MNHFKVRDSRSGLYSEGGSMGWFTEERRAKKFQSFAAAKRHLFSIERHPEVEYKIRRPNNYNEMQIVEFQEVEINFIRAGELNE